MRMETIKFGDFMDGSYKRQAAPKRKAIATKAAISTLIPLAVARPYLAAASSGDQTYITASSDYVTPVTAVPVNASEWVGEKTLQTLAHALDPVVDILVALSFPVASVVIVGACFYFMFGNPEKAWSTIQNAGLGYIIIQMSPLILDVLKSIGGAV